MKYVSGFIVLFIFNATNDICCKIEENTTKKKELTYKQKIYYFLCESAMESHKFLINIFMLVSLISVKQEYYFDILT